MTSHALQRVIVRMLYDPAYAARVVASPDDTLRGEDVTEAERSWVGQADPRAWRTDPYRRSRSLNSLLEEYPVGSGLVLRDHGGVPALDAFFSDDIFHRGMQRGDALAQLYANYLQSRSRRAERFVRLEREIAATRRPRPGRALDTWHLAPPVGIARVPEGTLSEYQALRSQVSREGTTDLERVIDASVRLATTEPAPGPEFHLIRDTPTGVEIEPLSEELFEILRLADRGCDREQLEARCVELGADPEDVAQILDGFVETGELRPPTAPG